jgi:hypothetical protein
MALVPNMHELVKRLCDTTRDNNEEVNQSHLFKFIEVVSTRNISVHVLPLAFSVAS